MDMLLRLIEEHSASRMMNDLDAEDSQSSKNSSRATRTRRKGKGKTSKRARKPAERHPDAPPPPSPVATGTDETAGITNSPPAARWEYPELVAEKATIPLLVWVQRVLHLPTAAGKAPPAVPRRDSDSERETWTAGMTWGSSQTLAVRKSAFPML